RDASPAWGTSSSASCRRCSPTAATWGTWRPRARGSRSFWGRPRKRPNRQGVHTAAKQEASLQLRTSLAECERLANILRLGVKQHYGIRSEKLAEFGLQPFRGSKTPDAEEPQPSAPTPPQPQTPPPLNPKQP